MSQLFKLFLAIHIAGGAVGLITGTVNLLRKKGDRQHRNTGRLFVAGMLAAGFSSLVLSVLNPNPFLFMVGIFTSYLVITGQRYLRFKGADKQGSPTLADRIISVVMLMAALLFAGRGILAVLQQNYFGIVFFTFGALGLLFVKADYTNYRGRSVVRNFWLLAHLQRMTGGYIASATAFLVVNAKYSPIQLPSILFWLLPTLVLTPLIIAWSRKYRIEKKNKILTRK